MRYLYELHPRDVDFNLEDQEQGQGPEGRDACPRSSLLLSTIGTCRVRQRATNLRLQTVGQLLPGGKKILRINSSSPGQKRQQGHYISSNSYLPGSLNVFVYVQKELKEEDVFCQRRETEGCFYRTSTRGHRSKVY